MKVKIQIIVNALLIFFFQVAFSQPESGKEPSIVTNYIHIVPSGYNPLPGGDKIVAFVLKNIDTSGNINWQSEKITAFEKDRNGYFAKVNTPDSIMKNTRGTWCTAYITNSLKNPGDTMQVDYGGVTFSTIKLILKSTPEGAESFLIPNRLWKKKIEKMNWQSDPSVLEKYRINTSSTNTYAYVDETVFVVIYKMDNEYKKAIHYTKPAKIEDEQTVWVKF